MAVGRGVMIIPDVSGWTVGLSALTPSCNAMAVESLRRRMQAAYDDSQAVVPVRTGALKASGRLEEHLSGLNLQIDLIYGGGDVDYAGWVEIFEPYLEASVTGQLAEFGPDGNELEMIQ